MKVLNKQGWNCGFRLLEQLKRVAEFELFLQWVELNSSVALLCGR